MLFSFNPHSQTYKADTIIIVILQTRKLRRVVIKYLFKIPQPASGDRISVLISLFQHLFSLYVNCAASFLCPPRL